MRSELQNTLSFYFLELKFQLHASQLGLKKIRTFSQTPGVWRINKINCHFYEGEWISSIYRIKALTSRGGVENKRRKLFYR